MIITAFISFTVTSSLAKKLERPMPSLSSPSSTTLHETENYKASRKGKHFIISLKHDHQVLSTSDINGGQAHTLKYIVNFQSVEGNGHDSRFNEILSLSNQQYHQQLADNLQLDSKLMASMGTAANINNLVHVQKQFRDITVDAFVTAGVKGNALRAGDSTRWYQGENGNELIKDVSADRRPIEGALLAEDSLPAEGSLLAEGSQLVKDSRLVKDSGTINIILMVNRSLTSGALAKAVTIITEAKSAALAELAIPSKQSSHLATGTGTDQYAIATPLKSSFKTLDSASGHLKLGELIGDAVRDAVIQGVGLQNGLERSDTRHLTHALGRFGGTKPALLKRFEELLDEDDYELLKKNKGIVFKDAKLVAAAYAYASVLDRVEYQTLSKNIQNDALLDQAVNAAIAISGKSQYWQVFREQLNVDSNNRLDLFVQATALGWQAKWSQ